MLSIEEYNKLAIDEMENEEFNKLYPRALASIERLTHQFYRINDWDTDNEWRKERYQLAIVAQMEYLRSLGVTSLAMIKQRPQSFSIGRTSVSGSAKGQSNTSGIDMDLISEDVYMFLEGTGLLYAGGVHHGRL